MAAGVSMDIPPAGSVSLMEEALEVVVFVPELEEPVAVLSLEAVVDWEASDDVAVVTCSREERAAAAFVVVPAVTEEISVAATS